MTCPIMRRKAARFVRSSCGLALAALAAGCGSRPSSVPDDAALIQLSRSSLSFEMDAYAPRTLSPGVDELQIANGGSKAPVGAPAATVKYLTGSGWLTGGVAESASGYRLWAQPIGIDLLDAGTYQATISIAWEGASNSPAAVAVQLTIRPGVQLWQAGPPTLADSRYAHTTTALLDGGAVTIGGATAERTIERLDPDTRALSWAPGQLLLGRLNQTATLLEDGRVFVAGGQSQDGDAPAGTWEIWDPQTGTITDHGALSKDRYDHAAVRLLDGRVLLVGGWRREAGVLGGTRSCEIFDPDTRTSTDTGSLHGDAAEVTTAVLLQDGSGKVLAVNQTPAGKEVGAELFDPASGAWTALESRPQPRIEHGLVALRDGRAVVFAGMDPETTGLLVSTEIYDPATGHWTAGGSLHALHDFVPRATALLPSGKALVAGGSVNLPLEDPFLFTATVETFDPATDEWSLASALNEPLLYHTVTVLGDGTVYAVGGVPDTDNRPEYWREPP